MFEESVKKLSFINTAEGYSYLALLFIAMPLKYLFGMALAVKIVGMIHGILFLIFCILLIMAWQETKWSMKNNIVFFIASIVPFGTFFTKNKIKSFE